MQGPISAFVFGNKSLGQNDSKLNLQICTWRLAKQSGITYIRVVKVVSLSDTNEERLVPVLAHKLVEFLSNEVHI